MKPLCEAPRPETEAREPEAHDPVAHEPERPRAAQAAAEAPAEPVRLERLRERPAAPRPVAATAAAEGGDVLRIVGQLKGQLLALETTKRALERELSTARRQVEHLAADNRGLREELEAAEASGAEVLRLREENALLEEE
jgi:hypothetical protein